MAKVIFLNTNHGSCEPELLAFLGKRAQLIDAFCLQEADEKIAKKTAGVLPGFSKYVAEKFVPGIGLYSIVSFIANRHKVGRVYEVMQGNLQVGLAEITKVSLAKKTILLCNVHGVSQPGDKMDNPDRLFQSAALINAVAQEKVPSIIGGDFNLFKNTKSIEAFEKAGFVNLIKKYKISTTRTKSAWKAAFDNRRANGYFGKQLFADYVFVSPGIKVKSFKVLDVEISNHLPLVLDFEV